MVRSDNHNSDLLYSLVNLGTFISVGSQGDVDALNETFNLSCILDGDPIPSSNVVVSSSKTLCASTLLPLGHHTLQIVSGGSTRPSNASGPARHRAAIIGGAVTGVVVFVVTVILLVLFYKRHKSVPKGVFLHHPMRTTTLTYLCSRSQNLTFLAPYKRRCRRAKRPLPLETLATTASPFTLRHSPRKMFLRFLAREGTGFTKRIRLHS